MLNTFNNRNDAQEHGFTLVELLVVILIIGVLVAIAVPAFLNQRSAAQEAALKSDVRNAGTLLEGQKDYIGTLPEDMKISDGVTLVPLRTAERDNKVLNAQFVDGKSTGWGHFISGGGGGVSWFKTEVIDDGTGYDGMAFRRFTATGERNPGMGQYVAIDLPETAKAGDTYSVGIAVRHNYSGARNLNMEFKDGKGAFYDINADNIKPEPNTWKYYTYTSTLDKSGATRVVMSLYGPMSEGQTLDVTAAVIVKGDKIDPVAALAKAGQDFCVQGYHESAPTNIWRYSSLDGGMDNKSC